MEPDVTIVCRKADDKIVNGLKDEAIKTFKETAGLDVQAKVITELSDNS